ncbi:MAG: decaprenyl-phosphate phosphoribosyltransferase [Candidatus Levybacteria bacterium]|nr:decaprenyl-phosphate phosphoribosyltransferase [Candidatus Levybacteria bacterium]MBI2622781.1 decaprenyl-phosphate phosphoribosyltransferase [Candidatus Levybacteria bacterium]MBI3069997.1 decaprenyl-phosphate phosphoribosyltransferase [Candidatus Levybacteria bacterium]
MKKTLFNILKLLRVRQWIKNLAVFAAIVFTGQLFEIEIFQKVFIGFLVFCALSSAIYIVNDIFDIEKDRLHPFKKYRPLAHNDISINFAWALAILLGAVSLYVGFFVTPAFFILLIIYCLLQLAYSFFLKNIAIVDVLAIAAGYILRVYAGEFASGFHISVWLLMTTIAISLFIAVGKRRSELTLVSRYSHSQIAAIRKSLSHYSERLLDVYASIFATSTFITYSLFTFLENPVGIKISFGLFLPDFLPVFFQKKWLMITIIPVVYGLMRYLQDIYEKHEGESPEKVLLSDIPLLTTVVVWVVLVIGIIYFIGS